MKPLRFLMVAFAVVAAITEARSATGPAEQWAPIPPVVSAPAGGVPSDAIVLFDGRNMDAWRSAGGGPARWTLRDGLMIVAPKTGHIYTKAAFGDIQLHLEWREPAEVEGSGQHRGNSGVFFMGLYELQILDSYQNPTYVNGQAGAIYLQSAPLVNVSRRPGEWQTYDVVWIAPRFADDGALLSPARATVFQNGVLVQCNVAVRGTMSTPQPFYRAHPSKLPLMLQNHGGDLVAFRNIWVRELALPGAQ